MKRFSIVQDNLKLLKSYNNDLDVFAMTPNLSCNIKFSNIFFDNSFDLEIEDGETTLELSSSDYGHNILFSPNFGLFKPRFSFLGLRDEEIIKFSANIPFNIFNTKSLIGFNSSSSSSFTDFSFSPIFKAHPTIQLTPNSKIDLKFKAFPKLFIQILIKTMNFSSFFIRDGENVMKSGLSLTFRKGESKNSLFGQLIYSNDDERKTKIGFITNSIIKLYGKQLDIQGGTSFIKNYLKGNFINSFAKDFAIKQHFSIKFNKIGFLYHGKYCFETETEDQEDSNAIGILSYKGKMAKGYIGLNTDKDLIFGGKAKISENTKAQTLFKLSPFSSSSFFSYSCSIEYDYRNDVLIIPTPQ